MMHSPCGRGHDYLSLTFAPSHSLSLPLATLSTHIPYLQYLLMQLARDPPLQQRVRLEADAIYRGLEREGRALAFHDLPRFELLTRCIAETLRLWNVASVVFPRVTSFDDELAGTSGCEDPVPVAEGTKFTFWFYGHHHSKDLWGDDVYDFNPDREWEPRELQLADSSSGASSGGCPAGGGTGLTPCSRRFHPFSVPTRDCLGKGFAMTEMRVLMPRILRAFRLEIPAGSELASASPTADNDVFANWSRHVPGPTTQPHEMWLRAVPVPPASRL